MPVEAQCLAPDVLAGKNLGEIAKLPIWQGNKKHTLSELFGIDGKTADKPEDLKIHINGDVRKVRRIGTGMSAGEIIIDGDVGTHLGEEMKGGRITVGANADSWAGAMIKGGTIEIKGNVGDYVGSAYRGTVKGMNGGTIIIHGNTGNELGCFMRKGLIKVYGSTAQFAGAHMAKGTLLIMGNSNGRAGAEMTGGKIIINGKVNEILPTFTIDSVKAKVKADGEEISGPFYLFVGDMTENGEGKLYVRRTSNPQLKAYEQYL